MVIKMFIIVILSLLAVLPVRIFFFVKLRDGFGWAIDMALNYALSLIMILILADIEDFSSMESKALMIVFLLLLSIEIIFCILNTSKGLRWVIRKKALQQQFKKTGFL